MVILVFFYEHLNTKGSFQLSFFRFFGSLFYEVILILAICLIASYPYVAIILQIFTTLPTIFFQLYLFMICGIYFVFCWTKSGQTLAMKAWNIRIVNINGKHLSLKKAILRYLISVPLTLSCISIIWILFDEDRRSAHDRILGTQIIMDNRIDV